MCFSAEASFIASASLTAVGTYAVYRAAKAKSPRFLPLAFLPFIFAFQQFCEGYVWVFAIQKYPFGIHQFAMLYLFFALFFWPFYFPFTLAIYDKARRNLFSVLGVGGFIFGLSLYGPYFQNPDSLYVSIYENSICYYFAIDYAINASGAIYIFFVVGSMLMSSFKRIKVLGIITAITAWAAWAFYIHTFLSVWCFFSAIVSLCIAYLAYKEADNSYS